MRHVIAVIALLASACAPEVPRVAETSGGEGAAGSVGVSSEALSASCSHGVHAQQALGQAVSHWRGTGYYNCTNTNTVSQGGTNITWQCGAIGSHTAQERVYRTADLWNGYCAFRIEKIPYGGSAWVALQKAECDPANNICFYSNL